KAYGGYNESLYVEWTDGAPSQASVQYKAAGTSAWQTVDKQLIRSTDNSVARVDVLGLAAGEYDIKIQPSSGDAIELAAPIAVQAYDRSGYAHFNYTEGVGAYNDDGTLKDNALVIYVTDENKNTVRTGYVDGVEVDLTPYLWQGKTGIGWILNNRAYDSDTSRANYGIQKLTFTYGAVDIRFIGTVNAEESSGKISLIEGLTDYNSTGNGGSSGDNGRMARITNAKNLTIEGIGEDATIYGWGFHFINGDNFNKYDGAGVGFEARNLTFRNYPEDALGMEGTQGNGTTGGGANAEKNDLIAPVEHCWIHNNTFYPGYAKAPAESDKAEGDGSCDFKRGMYFTCSYNYFEGCHKTNLLGSAQNSLTYNVTYHHNWWNGCGARQPLARRANIHYYNNYISGTTDTVISARASCYIFAEANYFDGCKNPTETNKEGTSAVKAYNNAYYACYETNTATQVESRTEDVSNNCKFIFRNIDYTHFDTDPTLFYYNAETKQSDCLLDDPVTARERVMQYAGVNGFGTSDTAMLTTVPSTTVQVPETGNLTIDLSKIGKAQTTVSGILFMANNGYSNGLKIRGQGIIFTLAAEAEIVVATSSTGDIAGELLREDGTVIAGKFTGEIVKVLPAGTYFIASGKKDKDTYITKLEFAETASSSSARVDAAIERINAIPATVALTDADKIASARMAYDALTSTEKANFDKTLVTKLENAETALG
ncbi:MAG: hypothetical protein K2I29_05065, partial [Clostridia bacterium]|nr:hypothetical protein [Clostridia bacterium]